MRGVVTGGVLSDMWTPALARSSTFISYFLSPSYAINAGLQGEHFSNGSLNGGGQNAALNTPWAWVFGG
jgi:hypothetical protein